MQQVTNKYHWSIIFYDVHYELLTGYALLLYTMPIMYKSINSNEIWQMRIYAKITPL